MSRQNMRQPPITAVDERLPIVAVALVWLAAALAMAVLYWQRLDESFASADNVMRLVQVRALLDGAPWFDPHEPRLAPPLGYDTHWSRLIDGGIAGLIVVFRQVAAPDLAERLVRCMWPLLLSFPAVIAVAGIAFRLGGEGAGRAALFAALPTVALLPTFRPGEIDHHNAQVMLTLVLIACSLYAERPWLAAAAGIAGGALLSIGLEAAYAPAIVAAVFGLLLVSAPAWSLPARNFGSMLAATTLAGYALITPGVLRFAPQCDALAINSALAVAIGGAGLAIVATFADRLAWRARLLALLLAGMLAIGAFVVCEPRCLRGPFGLIDPALFPSWLDQVWEMQPIVSLFRTDGPRSIIYVGFPLIATVSALLVGRSGLRTPLAWALIATFAAAEIITVGQARIIMYVIWLGLPLVGLAAHLIAQRMPRPAVAQISAAVLLSPAVVTFAVAAFAHQISKDEDRVPTSQQVLPCFRPENFAVLAELPMGLVLAPLDLAPSILAHTKHEVVAAPYHRADRAILLNQKIMDGPSDTARERVIATAVDYIVSCIRFKADTRPGSFHEALLAGTAGSWLEPAPGSETAMVRIWAVRALSGELDAGSP